ncbi:hypothetical protein [Paucilactobacillus kaifaensis]|nr:hypothetical protein [Paucilactobacillus kaifaensis]
MTIVSGRIKKEDLLIKEINTQSSKIANQDDKINLENASHIENASIKTE